MAKGKLYESDFEEALVQLFQESHWTYTHGDEINRKFTDPLIEEDLRNYLTARNHQKFHDNSFCDAAKLR